MDLSIQRLSKAYNQKSVFRDLSFDIRSGSRFAITGSNGSGKSTLLKILSGATLPTTGEIHYAIQGTPIHVLNIFRHVHFGAPYNDVIEELTLRELFGMHQRLGLLKAHEAFSNWVEKLQYAFNPDQQIKMYSSGMKQRVRLGLILLDDRPLILLDEPGSNLDVQGKNWLSALVHTLSPDQTLVIASNDPEEIGLCQDSVQLGIL